MVKHLRLGREILLIVLIKLILLSVLWKVCFSTPLAERLAAPHIIHHLTEERAPYDQS